MDTTKHARGLPIWGGQVSRRRQVVAAALPLALLLSACSDQNPVLPTPTEGPSSGSKPFVRGTHHVPADIVNDCSKDMSGALNAWIASVPAGSTISFDPGACYNVETGLIIEDAVQLTIEGNDAHFRVFERGESGRSNWTFRGGEKIIVRRVIAHGANPYAGIHEKAYDPKVEWQHAFKFQATQGVLLDQVQGYDVHGDFVEAETDWTRISWAEWPGEPVRNMVVRNSHFERSGRMGVGLTHVENFYMEGTYMGDIPMSAVDLELDAPTAVGTNIHVVGNRFGRVWHSIFANQGQGDTERVRVVFSNNVMTAPAQTCQPAITVDEYSPGEYRTGYRFENNTLFASGVGIDIKQAKEFVVRGNTIRWQPGHGCGDNFAVRVTDSHGGVVEGNMVQGYKEWWKADDLSTNVVSRAYEPAPILREIFPQPNRSTPQRY